MINLIQYKKNFLIAVIFLLIALSLKVLNSNFNKYAFYRDYKNIFIHKIFNIFGKGYKNCDDISKLKKFPKNATVIIGHAYGSPHHLASDKKEAFLDKKVESFLKKNSKNINTVIFNGDVFKNPSKEKWEKLYKKYSRNFKIYIVPGNHDYSGTSIIKNEFKKIFEDNVQQKLDYPFSISSAGFNLILEDSNTNETISNFKMYHKSELFFNSGKPNIIVRHHNPIKDLGNYKGKGINKPSLKQLSNRYTKGDILNIISGDYIGYLPNLACKRQKNISIIINGVGKSKKDKVIILSNKKIFQIGLE